MYGPNQVKLSFEAGLTGVLLFLLSSPNACATFFEAEGAGHNKQGFCRKNGRSNARLQNII